MKKAGLRNVGFARIDEPDEEKAKVTDSGIGIVSELNGANRINLTGDREGIAPVVDAAWKPIVDA